MALKTGTLWENKDTRASCNHGFASHVAHILFRDILGVRLDPVSRTVVFRVPALPLQWCEGRIPVGGEWIQAKWYREGDTVFCRLQVPAGFRTEIINESSYDLVTG
jgi:alpha-L-rhamnosidase